MGDTAEPCRIKPEARVMEEFVLIKRGLYWRPNSQGYTGILDEAGRYSREEAETRARDGEDGVTMLAFCEASRFSPACWGETKFRVLMAENKAMREALLGIPAIAEEIRLKWDQGMKSGKLLIALIDPTLRYRADCTAVHEAPRLHGLRATLAQATTPPEGVPQSGEDRS